MSASLKARRMARNHRRLAQAPRLNLVALMDIFTILVLFLMVNNGDVEVLQADRALSLPESVSEQKPPAALLVKVTASDILVHGRPVDTIQHALEEPGDVLDKLAEALQHQAGRAAPMTVEEEMRGRAIAIMGDRHMSYALLQRILATCAQSDYRNVSLAVNSRPAADGEAMLVAAGGL